jgi:hypothetical protein
MSSILTSLKVELDVEEGVEGRDENGDRFADERSLAMMGLLERECFGRTPESGRAYSSSAK